MHTGLGVTTSIHARARINFILVAALLAFAVIVVVGGFLIAKSGRTDGTSHVQVAQSAPASTVASPQVMPAAGERATGVEQLLVRAADAVRQQHYLTPTGNNAFVLYLSVLKLQPGNQAATEALRETFSVAADSAEQTINANRLVDAQRQIDLLATADPGNYIVTILRSKLSAQRKLLDLRQDQLASSQLLAAEARRNEQLATEIAQQRARQLAAQPKVVLPAPKVALQVPVPSPKLKVNATASTEAVLLQGALPSYPASALSENRGGWVLLSFMVGVDGRTSEVTVVNSQPHRVFDRAALDAVRRYRFKPATRDGAPVASQRQQRIEFTQ